jgi:hypothetical protein
VWQHVFNQVIPLFLQKRGIFKRFLFDNIILLVLVEGSEIEPELVHPAETAG